MTALFYGPQKGLNVDDIQDCSRSLSALSGVLGGDPTMPGGGAAGGIDSPSLPCSVRS